MAEPVRYRLDRDAAREQRARHRVAQIVVPEPGAPAVFAGRAATGGRTCPRRPAARQGRAARDRRARRGEACEVSAERLDDEAGERHRAGAAGRLRRRRAPAPRLLRSTSWRSTRNVRRRKSTRSTVSPLASPWRSPTPTPSGTATRIQSGSATWMRSMTSCDTGCAFVASRRGSRAPLAGFRAMRPSSTAPASNWPRCWCTIRTVEGASCSDAHSASTSLRLMLTSDRPPRTGSTCLSRLFVTTDTVAGRQLGRILASHVSE